MLGVGRASALSGLRRLGALPVATRTAMSVLGGEGDAAGAPAQKSAHLVWSPGFMARFARHVVALVGVAAVVSQNEVAMGQVRGVWEGAKLGMQQGAHSLALWSVLGLLSSACCAIQILLNAASIGCAGFNTYLGPLRPSFLALTAVLQAGQLYFAFFDGRASGRMPVAVTLSGLAVAAALSLMPEALALLAASRSRRGKAAAAAGAAAGARLRVRFDLGDAMGCASCAESVQRTLLGDAAVLQCSASVERGSASALVCLQAQETAEEAAGRLAQKLAAAGFGAEVAGLVAEAGEPEGDAAPARRGIGSALSSPARWLGLRGGGAPASYAPAVTLGLASSSCCAVQLMLNALAAMDVLHVGCAKFNTVLGPLRPYLRSATLAWLAALWAVALRGRAPRRRALAAQSALCLALMFMPEALRFCAEHRVFGVAAVAPPVDAVRLLRFRVDGMGCEACEQHVRSAIERSSGVVRADVDFASGEAVVHAVTDWGFDAEAIAAVLERDGFDMLREAGGGGSGP